ncbi:MAG: hypothetical protein RSP_17560 [Rhodanobacter sp.]
MNWVTRQIDEFTLWLLNDHRSRMNLVRQYLWRQARNRAHADHRHMKRQRQLREDTVRPQAVRQLQQRQETRALLAEHRAWNASRARGHVQHF